jgi:oligopeptidase A
MNNFKEKKMSQFIPFSVNLENFIEELNALLESNNQAVTNLLTQKEKTYKNFVRPLAMLEEKLERFFTPLSHINAVNNTKQTQETYTEALPILTEYSTKLSQNLDIYTAFKEIQTKEIGALDQEQKRVLELNILNFELSGAHLDEKTKERLQEINIEKSELSNQFSQNLLDATNAYEYIITDEKDIDGLPESEIETAQFLDNGVTKYRFTLQMPSYIAYMTYGKNEKIRETLYKAYVTRAPENEKILQQILALRDEMSKLLGYGSYSEYSLASKMAPDTKSVLDFLNTLSQKAKKQAQSELAEIETLAKKPLNSYDMSYYSELLKKEKYELDEELYRPYFEQESVMDGMFTFLDKLFGITFEKLDEPLWDTKASAYYLYLDGTLKAKIYFDLEARKGKRGGAWMHNWQTHCKDENDKIQLASAFVVCNFPPSSQTAPSLLRHDDVVTLFHEMGHTIHHLLSEVEENEVSGVNGVEWDAVEFPSQFLENFAYEPKVLEMFAKHYKTGEILPQDMIDKLVKAKNFLSALGMLRQLEFSLFDFILHTKLHNAKEAQTLLDTLRKETSLIAPPSYNKFQNGFSHIFSGGYAAGYYSYKWAEVLSADCFYNIIDEGVFESVTAKRYRDIILKKGGSQTMQELFVELMGREVKPENLLRLNGIDV